MALVFGREVEELLVEMSVFVGDLTAVDAFFLG